MIPTKFHGANVIFWIGVVEDRNDQNAEDGYKLGRVRVRILGYHSQTKTANDQTGEGIPTNKLHWATPINPVTSASVSGVGTTPLGLVEGSWVMGLAMDGEALQELYVLGSLSGVPEEKLNPADQGFCDPNEEYPRADHLNESDVNRLARNENTGQTLLQKKKSNRDFGIPIAGGGTWNEPDSAYAAEYPKNHVNESESGHVTEVDDTEGNERLHQWHKSGTYTEINASGDEVHKIVGKSYEIIADDSNVYVKGDLNITVDGDAKIQVKGDTQLEGLGSINAKSLRKINLWSVEGISMMSLGSINLVGQMGVTVAGVIGPAIMGSPVNQGSSTARAVG